MEGRPRRPRWADEPEFYESDEHDGPDELGEWSPWADQLDQILVQGQQDLDEKIAEEELARRAASNCRCCGEHCAPPPSRADGVCDNCGLYVDDGAARWSRSVPGLSGPSGPELMAANVRRLQDSAADKREEQQEWLEQIAAEQEREEQEERLEQLLLQMDWQQEEQMEEEGEEEEARWQDAEEDDQDIDDILRTLYEC
jgi:hypothetical protein